MKDDETAQWAIAQFCRVKRQELTIPELVASIPPTFGDTGFVILSALCTSADQLMPILIEAETRAAREALREWVANRSDPLLRITSMLFISRLRQLLLREDTYPEAFLAEGCLAWRRQWGTDYPALRETALTGMHRYSLLPNTPRLTAVLTTVS